MKKRRMITIILLITLSLVGCSSAVQQFSSSEKQDAAATKPTSTDTGNTAADSVYSIYTEADVIEFVFSDSAVLQTETIGDLTLGMTEQEITAIMGQPASTSNVSMESPDGAFHFNWFYDTGTDQNNDTVLALADIGDGWFLNEITLSGDSTLRLSTGIGIGSTEKDVAAAYPLAVKTHETVIKNDHSIDICLYGVDDGLYITTEHGICKHISLGRWLQMPPEEAWKTEPLPYDLYSDEITIYQMKNQQWNATTVTNKAAKGICTILTISEPEASVEETNHVSAWMDFGNGTIVELQGNDRAVVWTCDDEFSPDITHGLTYQIGGVFSGLDDYVDAALADSDAGWEK